MNNPPPPSIPQPSVKVETSALKAVSISAIILLFLYRFPGTVYQTDGAEHRDTILVPLVFFLKCVTIALSLFVRLVLALVIAVIWRRRTGQPNQAVAVTAILGILILSLIGIHLWASHVSAHPLKSTTVSPQPPPHHTGDQSGHNPRR